MQKKHLTIFLFSLITFINCSKNENKESNPEKDYCTANINAQEIIHNNGTREYLIHIPENYNESLKTPILLNFHGFGGSAGSFMLETNMTTIADSENFILVYPQGNCLNGSSHWNPCPSGGDNKSSTDDLGFIESLINEIDTNYNIDLDRIYAVGYSNGGMMAYGLANQKSEIIAAVASVSGAMLDCVNTVNHPMPVLHLHGTQDGVIPYDGNDYYSSTQNTLDYWIDINNITQPVNLNTDNTGSITVENYTYTNNETGVSVRHIKYVNGDHIWFDTTYNEKNTGQIIWDFVSQYDINGVR